MRDRPAVHVRAVDDVGPAEWLVTCDVCAGGRVVHGTCGPAAWERAMRHARVHAAARGHRIALADRAGVRIEPCVTAIACVFDGRPLNHDAHWWRPRLAAPDAWCPGSGRPS